MNKKIDKETDKTYQTYLQYITFLLEDSGDMGELPQIKQLASRLTLAKEHDESLTKILSSLRQHEPV